MSDYDFYEYDDDDDIPSTRSAKAVPKVPSTRQRLLEEQVASLREDNARLTKQRDMLLRVMPILVKPAVSLTSEDVKLLRDHAIALLTEFDRLTQESIDLLSQSKK